MGATLGELILMAGAFWLVLRLLEPLRRRIERRLLRLFDPSRADEHDAELEP